jgi:hypothetical protein
LTDQSLTDRSLKPFASGDLFVPAPRLDPTARYPTGQGVIRQYDASFRLKAEAETGHTGLISGLGLSPKGVLHALDPQARACSLWGPDGKPMRAPEAPEAGFGSIIFLPDGGWLMGEHLCGGPGPFEGQGRVMRFGADGRLLATYATAHNGGVSGFLGVTHMALADDGRTLYHVSETGPHVYAHDLIDNRPLGPVYTRTDPPGMVFGLALLPDSRLAVALGGGLRLVDPRSGQTQDVTLPPGRGWANVVVRPTGKSLFVLDFFGGQLAELDLADFSVLRCLDLGNPQGLTSIAEVP